MIDLAKRYQKITAEIQSHGRSVLFIAVSKGQSWEKMRTLYDLGHRDFGENYPQELLEKVKLADRAGISDMRFHMIGHLQTNKVKQVVPFVESILSVDSIKLLMEIEKRSTAMGRKMKVGFQLNIDQEATKSGFLVQDLTDLASAVSVLRSVQPWGLMILPDPNQEPAEAFRRLSNLSEKFKDDLGAGRSMGMSQDYGVALSCGSTCIRVGTALFGERSPK